MFSVIAHSFIAANACFSQATTVFFEPKKKGKLLKHHAKPLLLWKNKKCTQ